MRGEHFRQHVAWIVAMLLLPAGLASTQTLELRSGRYEVEDGSVVEMAGGFLGLTYEMDFSGDLRIEVDPAVGTGRIVASDLWLVSEEIGGVPFQFPTTEEDLPLEELEGTLLDSSTLELVSPVGGAYPYQTAILRLTASPSGLVLDGYYDEGCCDRYILTFDNVALQLMHGPVAAVPTLGGTGATVLALLLGFFGIALLKRRIS